MYNSINDAAVALSNSGVYEWFDFDETPEDTVVQWMYLNEASPESAAEYFEAA